VKYVTNLRRPAFGATISYSLNSAALKNRKSGKPEKPEVRKTGKNRKSGKPEKTEVRETGNHGRKMAKKLPHSSNSIESLDLL
jgi:hypothetical protein